MFGELNNSFRAGSFKDQENLLANYILLTVLVLATMLTLILLQILNSHVFQGQGNEENAAKRQQR